MNMPGALSTAAWVAHDLGTAVAVGGGLFGRIALEPSVRNIEDREERGQVVSDAWRRFGGVQLGATAIMAATWYAGRATLGGLAAGGGSTSALVVAKDILVGTTLATAIGAAVTGNLMSKQREQDAVPMDAQGEVAEDAPAPARALGRVTDAFGFLNLCAGLGVVAVTAVLAMQAGKSKTWKAVSRFLP
ncbi:MAG TPA: hypothetical protein VHM31_01530 [Polyangia bacterium]|nr:hypothetical protein [Polyangia bacterium]